MTFCLSIHIPFIWFGQNLARTYYLTPQTSFWENFWFFQNLRWLPGVKVQKSTKFDPTNHNPARHTDSVHTIRTKFGANISTTSLHKQAFERLFYFFQNPWWPLGVKGKKLTKFDLITHILAQHKDSYLTKISNGHTTSHKKQPSEIIFFKIHDGCPSSLDFEKMKNSFRGSVSISRVN